MTTFFRLFVVILFIGLTIAATGCKTYNPPSDWMDKYNRAVSQG